jgi:hypothetical protein
MGHCGKFGYTLWTTALNKTVPSSSLWAITQDFFMRYGHNAVFGFALLAVAQNQLPERRST